MSGKVMDTPSYPSMISMITPQVIIEGKKTLENLLGGFNSILANNSNNNQIIVKK